MTYKVLIVDDREVVRSELRNLFALSDEIEVLADAANGSEALRMVKDIKPQIVLMDLEMPEMDGFEATKQIKAVNQDTTVIIYSVYADIPSQQLAREVGAEAFIVKGTDLPHMLSVFEKTTREREKNDFYREES
jgi:YesN/AraC family two-component response regulator